MENLTEIEQDIVNWNYVGGNDLNDPEQRDRIIELYKDLVYEEMRETVFSNTEEEFADGLCDIVVTLTPLNVLVGVDNIKEVEVGVDWTVPFNPTSNMLPLDETMSYAFALLRSGDKFFNSFDEGTGVELMEEVMRANWTKFPKVGEVVPEEECAYIEGQGRYKGVDWSVVNVNGVGYYVFKDENGKIVKPSTFQEPQLIPILDRNRL